MRQMENQFLQPPMAQMRGGDKYPAPYDSGIGGTDSNAIHSENAFDDGALFNDPNAFGNTSPNESHFSDALGYDPMQTQALDLSLCFGGNWINDQA